METMTAEEKQKFDKMESTVEQIQSDVKEIKTALLGNTLSGEKGLTGRLNEIDIRQKSIETEMKELREERVKNTVYVKIITWLLAVIGIGIVGLIFDYLK